MSGRASVLQRLLMAAALITLTLIIEPQAARAEEPLVPAFEGVGGRSVKATAYTAGPESTGKRPGHPQYGITFSGTKAEEGRTIAVDPKRIPLGSLVFVEELQEYRVAEDTGGAVQGSHIDLYMEDLSRAVRWGIRRVRIQVFPKI